MTEYPTGSKTLFPCNKYLNLLDDLDDEQIAVAVRKVSDFDIRDLIKAEQNLARFMHNVIDYIGEESNSLIGEDRNFARASPAFPE